MMANRIVAVAFLASLALFVANDALAQDCPASMGGGGTGGGTPPTGGSASGFTLANGSPTTTTTQPTMGTQFVGGFGSSGLGAANLGGSPADPYMQALQSMSPTGMVMDLRAQQVMAVQRQQAQTARRRAIREPARQRMREQNAQRYYEAGQRAEAAGNYDAARKYYRRASRIQGGASSDAQQALDSL